MSRKFQGSVFKKKSWIVENSTKINKFLVVKPNKTKITTYNFEILISVIKFSMISETRYFPPESLSV